MITYISLIMLFVMLVLFFKKVKIITPKNPETLQEYLDAKQKIMNLRKM